MTCETSNYAYIKELHEKFGGTFKRIENKCKPHWKILFRWQVADERAANVCRIVLPFLKEKKPQAELLLKLRETIVGGPKRLPLEMRQRRDEIFRQLQDLKHVRDQSAEEMGSSLPDVIPAHRDLEQGS